MSRPFASTEQRNRKSKGGDDRPPPGAGPEWARPGGATPAEAELIDGPVTLVPARYESRPVRPFAQMAVRATLWAAVVVGALGGLVGLLRTPAEPDPVAAGPTGPTGVPGPVAGMAETVVRAWLTIDADSEDEVKAMFVDLPTLDADQLGGLRVSRTTAIAGRVLQEGYWAVTVAAEVSEDVPVIDPDDPGRGEDAGDAETEERKSTWYLEVAMVGNPETGLMALTAPAVLPTAPRATTGWAPSARAPQEPDAEDPTAKTVQGFLNAVLAGDGDPERYLAPRVEVTAADPPVFADITVLDQAIDEIGGGEYRVLARVTATTPGGSRQVLTYELMVVERVDRLEITQFAGAPTLVAGTPQPAAEEDTEADGTEATDAEGAGTATTEAGDAETTGSTQAPGDTEPDPGTATGE